MGGDGVASLRRGRWDARPGHGALGDRGLRAPLDGSDGRQGAGTGSGRQRLPLHYRIREEAFAQAVGQGLPSNASPVVIGDDYVLPAGYNGKLTLDTECLRQCPADEWWVVEAWDLS